MGEKVTGLWTEMHEERLINWHLQQSVIKKMN